MPQDEFQAQLEELKRGYSRGLPDKIRKIEATVSAFLAGAWSEDGCATTHRLVHSLAGSAGTYGHAGISAAARAAESVFKKSQEARALPDAAQQGQVRDLIVRMKELAEDAARALPS